MLLLTIAVLFVSWEIYKFIYYRSDNFYALKEDTDKYVLSCNELNNHIEDLKRTYSTTRKINMGNAKLIDNSNYNYKRPKQRDALKSDFIHDCSASVCKNAETQPLKYVCKYFNIKSDEKTLGEFETILNNFSAAEEGKKLLSKEITRISSDIEKDVPFLIRKFNMKKFILKLGFEEIDFRDLHYPTYKFRYISPGGNKTTICAIRMDLNNLNKLVIYLSDKVKYRKSIAGQRALMTSKLRREIKERDNFTCRICDNSTRKEENLLLEIDHIIPVSKGGLTEKDNLQTLCWKCNRTKGNKIIQ